MEKISVLIPTYNEEENVITLSQEIVMLFKNELAIYDYKILLMDNYSKHSM